MRFNQTGKHLLIPIMLIGIVLLLTACAPPQSTLDTRLQVRLARALGTPAVSGTPESAAASPQDAPDAARDIRPGFQTIEPLEAAVSPPGAHQDPRQLFDDAPSLTVAVDVLPLHDFVHRVFGDLLQVNYVLNSRVPEKEKISLNLHQPVSPRKLFDTVNDILAAVKVSVREKEGIFYIEPTPEKAPVTMGIGRRPDDIPIVPGQIRQVIPLRFVKPENVVFALANIPGVRIDQVGTENALQATGTREGVAQVMQFLAVLDRPAMRGRYAGIARLSYRSPEEMANKLKQTLQIEGIPVANRAEGGGLHIVALDTVSMLAIFAAERQWLSRAQYWIDLLDTPAHADERRYYIYSPQNSRAADLMETLENILGLPSRQKVVRRDAGRELDLFQPVGRQRDIQPAPSDPALKVEIRETLPDASQIRLSIDETRNALIVYASAEQYLAIESLLKRLDIMPAQVLIEATVAEVTLVDDLKFGLEWFIRSTGHGQTTTASTIGGLGLGTAGLLLSSIADADKFRVLINALAEEELVQVLSSPRITVRDGQLASITVGTQVPVITSETARADAAVDDRVGVVRTYQYRTTGITLQITPTVHARDVVTLQIAQDVSEPSASGGENPLILNRTLSTNVVATSGQTLVIGGLIKESKGIKNSRVPFLSNIPVIGYLFKSTVRGGERTELVVLITPHIIHSTQQADGLRDALFDSFNHLKW